MTGQELKMEESKPGKVSARYAIIAGTIGESGWIDVLAFTADISARMFQ